MFKGCKHACIGVGRHLDAWKVVSLQWLVNSVLSWITLIKEGRSSRLKSKDYVWGIRFAVFFHHNTDSNNFCLDWFGRSIVPSNTMRIDGFSHSKEYSINHGSTHSQPHSYLSSQWAPRVRASIWLRLTHQVINAKSSIQTFKTVTFWTAEKKSHKTDMTTLPQVKIKQTIVALLESRPIFLFLHTSDRLPSLIYGPFKITFWLWFR